MSLPDRLFIARKTLVNLHIAVRVLRSILTAMIKSEKIEALVLSRRNLGDADRLVTLFSKSHGLMRVLAKGVRSVPSRRGSHLEPFTNILALVNGEPGRYFLATSETENYFQDLHDDQDALMRVHLIVRVVTGLYNEGEKQEYLFEALGDCFEVLPKCNAVKRSLLEIAIYLVVLKSAGYFPQLKSCRICESQQVDDAVVLDESLGGWVCLTCRVSLATATKSITKDGLKVLRYLAIYPERALKLSVDQSLVQQLEEAVRQYVSGFVTMQLGDAHVNNMR